MKILNGKIKLDKRDIRVGNFVYTMEPEHIKVQDISLTITHRIHRGIAKAQLIEMMLEDPKKYQNELHNYATIMYNLLCTAPDATFYEDISKAVLDCVNRHKDVYGIKDNITPEENAQILQEERELHEAVEDIKEKVGDEAPVEAEPKAEASPNDDAPAESATE